MKNRGRRVWAVPELMPRSRMRLRALRILAVLSEFRQSIAENWTFRYAQGYVRVA